MPPCVNLSQCTLLWCLQSHCWLLCSLVPNHGLSKIVLWRMPIHSLGAISTGMLTCDPVLEGLMESLANWVEWGGRGQPSFAMQIAINDTPFLQLLVGFVLFLPSHAYPSSGMRATYSACVCPSEHPAHPSACSLAFSVPCPASCCMDKWVIVKALSPPLFTIVFFYLWCIGWSPYCISGIQCCSSQYFQLAFL